MSSATKPSFAAQPSRFYRMPAEWEKHTRTWLAWPHQRKDWPGKFAPIPWVFVEFIRHLTAVERVGLIVRDEKMQDQAAEMLARGGVPVGHIDFVHAPTNRIWLRDAGPIFVRSSPSPLAGEGRGEGDLTALDFRFNAWAKYKNHALDNALPGIIAGFLNVPTVQPTLGKRRVVLEGGSIDVNGKGTLLTTEECLLSEVQCRNPGFSREDYENVFHDYLGITNTIWLDKGIIGDDTHGHVDDLARFVAVDTVVTVVENDRYDPNYPLLQENLTRLKAARDQEGKPLTIAELPMPKPLEFEGERLPASYANFLIANDLVLVPTFNDLNDRVALGILADLFPRHSVVGIHCVDFVWGLGTLHCASQQEPALSA